eukprot:6181552-Pleurochrysis_carterae.AAC.3
MQRAPVIADTARSAGSGFGTPAEVNRTFALCGSGSSSRRTAGADIMYEPAPSTLTGRHADRQAARWLQNSNGQRLGAMPRRDTPAGARAAPGSAALAAA